MNDRSETCFIVCYTFSRTAPQVKYTNIFLRVPTVQQENTVALMFSYFSP